MVIKIRGGKKMNTNFNYSFIMVAMITTIIIVLFSDVVEAQYGRMHRATRRRTAIVVSSATHEKDEQAAAQQKSTETTQTTQTTQSQDQTKSQQTTSTTPPPTTKTTGAALAIGTVVTSLPEGCTTSSVDNQEYYHCGSNWYRSAFQGNTLVYVTTDPPK